VRSASGISEAIAEGCGKNSDWELARYVNIGCGSVTELQTQLVLAQKHHILSGAKLKFFWRECSELRRMMVVFERKVRERAARKDVEKRNASQFQPQPQPSHRAVYDPPRHLTPELPDS
jgi:four helix bundle protein